MSDITAPIEGHTAPEGASTGLFEQPASGSTEGAGEETLGTQAPTYYTVKVDGVEQQVPIDELVNGYQRQSAFTRKTQELAVERQNLQHAAALWEQLQADPKAVVEALTEHFAEVLDETPLDPEEQRLREVESFIQQAQDRELQSEVDAEIARLRATYGEVDAQAVLEYAVENEIPNLEAALLHQRAVIERDRRRAESDAQALAAKRAGAPVAGGHSAAAGSTQGAPETVRTIKDALAAAMREANVSSLREAV